MTDTVKYRIASQVVMFLTLVAVLAFHFLAAVIAGLLMFQIVRMMVPFLRRLGIKRRLSRIVALAIPAMLFGLAIFAGVTALVGLVSGPDSLVMLLQRMADIIEQIRRQLPTWALTYLPDDLGELQTSAANALRSHAGEVGAAGQYIGRAIFHIIIGMVVGGLLAIRVATQSDRPLGPLAEAMENRFGAFASAFRSIVFSQIRISALNTTLTALYLAVALPAFGIHLPLIKTVIAATFILGLIPILGNLMSNTIIVIVGLSISPLVAATSLLYLIVIHKLEYFMNARIIGTEINSHAWELLIALLVMEAVFGIPGLIAAPIYYAYFKRELIREGLI